ncbi:hypothetical protein HMPREF9624_01237 [Oribacterium asaccharolyticum ACB7]|uniref:Membrane protein YkvI n=1 Tax=Oribacterium asaccharolyticum ACB7 TaxID=796944 RepID=G9WWF3_9FIRM|nr:membrane protein [Oribacterium asaccharolyticum]EHL09822.1 hypothetical protein HMPREF9624_01237 [Oribacterium asaccharolyticum ACB7]
MLKRILNISLAYVGVVIGAGLSSGQDLMQYFVSFGKWGIIGTIVLGIISVVFGKIIITLGSYFRSNDHSEVLSQIAGPITNKILDIALIVSCFVVGFVMIAGAGSNLNQQFGLPFWAGGLLCAALIIIVSFLDFEKITGILGIFTPIVFIMIIIIAVHTFTNRNFDFDELEAISATIPSPMPNVWISLLNYFALTVMTGVPMAFVLGGSIMRIGVAEKSGILGGLVVSIIITVATCILYVNIKLASTVDMPMLAIAEQIHPIFSLIYALIIYGLIFNTAFSLFYAFAKRFSSDNPKHFYPVLIAAVVIGYALSFMGFKELVSIMYPILGYIGFVMLAILTIAWIKEKSNIKGEKFLRRKMIRLITKKYDDNQDYTIKDKEKFHQLGEDSIVDTQSIKSDIKDLIKEEFNDDTR